MHLLLDAKIRLEALLFFKFPGGEPPDPPPEIRSFGARNIGPAGLISCLSKLRMFFSTVV